MPDIYTIYANLWMFSVEMPEPSGFPWDMMELIDIPEYPGPYGLLETLKNNMSKVLS